jgi:HK97 family phage major capsid protein
MKPILSHEGRDYFSESELKARVAELDLEHRDETMPKAAREEWNRLNETIDEFEARRERITELAKSRRGVESGDGATFQHGYTRTDDPQDPRLREARDVGLRAIEHHDDVLTAKAADRLDGLVRSRDPDGSAARYLDAVGNPHYNSAFGKMVMDPTTGHLRFTAREVEAVRKVSAVEEERAMSIGTGSAGGFAVPFVLDQSILLTSTGALNPIRGLATSTTISGAREWRGVASDGVTANYVAEGTVVTDASPTLVQPAIITYRWHVFVPITLELFQDWSELQNELIRLASDARDVNDATQFLTGAGASSPGGILNIGGTGGLTTTQRVQTAVSATYAVGDPWTLKAQVPPRFIPTSTYVAAPGIWDKTYRFVAQGSTTEPRQFSDGDRGGDFVGRPKAELSTMVTTTTTASRVMIAGDFSGYNVVDRLGVTAEIIPHLFGAAQGNLPTGYRGLFIWAGPAPASPSRTRSAKWRFSRWQRQSH